MVLINPTMMVIMMVAMETMKMMSMFTKEAQEISTIWSPSSLKITKVPKTKDSRHAITLNEQRAKNNRGDDEEVRMNKN